ncbi:MAG: TolC family protein [Acidobacteria bacterium]|nr:TolC family protein [Acidobacteriota bacterium]
MRVHQILRLGLSPVLVASLAAQQLQPVMNSNSIAPIRPIGSIFTRPYRPVELPDLRLGNSKRLADLIRGGTLYLTAQDAVLLALENNMDIEIARYGPIVSDWRITRAEAGGALPGVPSAASQAGSVAAGQGVTGSQNAAGVAGTGNAQNSNNTSNATITQVGTVTQNLDPAFQETTTFSHISTPQANTTQSATSVLISNTRTNTGQLQQGFITGGSVTLRFSQNYLNENAPTNLLNPTVAPNLQFTASHSLLSGFGRRVNARNITIAKVNRRISDLTFETTVLNIVNQTLELYYNLAASHEDLRAKTNAADTAKLFFNNVKRQVELGAAAPPELITAENDSINSDLAVVTAQTTIEQQELRLKNLISRNGLADKALLAARIQPVDPVTIPDKDDLPPIAELVKEAQAKRVEVMSAQQSLTNAEESSLGTKSALLPSLQVFGSINQAGLAGNPRVAANLATPDPKFVGGTGTALGQVFGLDFQTRRIGTFFNAIVNNRQAQADYTVDTLSLRQSELSQAKRLSQIEVDIASAVAGLRQARVRHEYAVQNAKLQDALVKAEQRKYDFGASRPYDVIQMRRDLGNAQSAEVSAKASYMAARILLNTMLGRTLSANNISIASVR